MLRAPEDGSYNLADYLREHGVELGLAELVHVRQTDEVLAPLVSPRLEEQRDAENRALAHAEAEYAREVRRSARWQGDHLALLPCALFQLISGMSRKKYVRFSGSNLDVAVARSVVARARSALRTFDDVSTFIDVCGLHFSWRGGHGGLNLRPQSSAHPDDTVLVHLPSPTTRRTPPVLLGEVLAELGFGS